MTTRRSILRNACSVVQQRNSSMAPAATSALSKSDIMLNADKATMAIIIMVETIVFFPCSGFISMSMMEGSRPVLFASAITSLRCPPSTRVSPPSRKSSLEILLFISPSKLITPNIGRSVLRSPMVCPTRWLFAGTLSSVDAPCTLSFSSADTRVGSSFCMASIDSMPTARQNSPTPVVTKMLRWVPGWSSIYMPEIIRFGGVPIKVHIPPMPEA